MQVDGRALVVLGMVACGPAIPPLPSRGGPAWLELRSEHVTLWTDASAERGRQIVREIERRRQVILAAMGQPVAPSPPAFVIAVRNRAERAVYLSLDFIGVTWGPHNPIGQPGILLAANDNDREHVIDHEMGHVISMDVILDQPPWLAEGFATYFETFDLFSDDATVEVGRPRADRGRILRQTPPLGAAELFACEAYGCMDGLFYATSWAAVSFLLNERYDPFIRYLHRLNELSHGRPATPWYETIRDPSPEQARAAKQRRDQSRAEAAQAWREAFPDLPPDQFDRALGEWLVSGRVRLPRIKLTRQQLPVTERSLGDADALAARSWLRLRFTRDHAATRGDAEAALALDRTHVLAWLVEAALTRSIGRDDARATAAAHPDDWRALRLVELALHGTPEGDAALHRLCAMTADAAPECWRARTGH